MLSASCSSVTTCAVAAAEALRALDRRLQQPHGRHLHHAPERQRALAARYAPTRTRGSPAASPPADGRPGRRAAPGRPARRSGPSRPRRAGTRRARLPTSNAGSPRPASSQSTSSSAGRGAAPRRREAQAVLPAQVAVHERVLARHRARSSLEPAADELARLDAGDEVLRRELRSTHERVRGLGQERPQAGPASRHVDGQAVQRARAPGRAMRAGDAREAAAVLAPVARARRACGARGRPPGSWMHDRRHVVARAPASPRQLAQDRRLGASDGAPALDSPA